MSSSSRPLTSIDGASGRFSIRRDDSSNREFSSIDNDRWKMSPSTAPQSYSLTLTARIVPLTRLQTVTSCAMTLPSTVRHRRLEDPRRATHLMIRPKTCTGPLHSM
jgi:hypothetical protein